jgi:hypothetical protein
LTDRHRSAAISPRRRPQRPQGDGQLFAEGPLDFVHIRLFCLPPQRIDLGVQRGDALTVLHMLR